MEEEKGIDIDDESIEMAFLQRERQKIEQAQKEIQAILEKYGLVMQAVAIIPATEIRIVPKR